MRYGNHEEGAVVPYYGSGLRDNSDGPMHVAKCSCGWSVVRSLKEDAEAALNRHQHGISDEKSTKLEDGDYYD